MTRNIYRTSHKRHDWPYSHIDRADIADRHLEKSTCRQANRRSSHENIFSRKPSLGVRQTIRYPNLHSTILANSNPYRDKIPNYSWSHRIVRLQHPMSHGISEKDYTHTTSNNRVVQDRTCDNRVGNRHTRLRLPSNARPTRP